MDCISFYNSWFQHPTFEIIFKQILGYRCHPRGPSVSSGSMMSWLRERLTRNGDTNLVVDEHRFCALESMIAVVFDVCNNSAGTLTCGSLFQQLCTAYLISNRDHFTSTRHVSLSQPSVSNRLTGIFTLSQHRGCEVLIGLNGTKVMMRQNRLQGDKLTPKNRIHDQLDRRVRMFQVRD